MRKKHLIFIAIFMATSLISGVAYSKIKGTISGQVTDPSGSGLANVYVGVYDYDTNHWVKGSTTDSLGNYSFNVAAGSYRMQFIFSASDGYFAPEWYDKKDSSEAADVIVVTPLRTTSDVDAQLEIGGTISVRVTNASGDALENVFVSAYDPNSSHWVYGLATDDNGNYSFNVPVGNYKVHFTPLASSGYYAPQWYDNKHNSQGADLIPVAAQTTSNITAQLVTGATISGRVTGPSGNGLGDVYVDAEDLSYNWVAGSTTDSNGNYSFNVPVGSYKLEFAGNSFITGYYAPEWFNNRSNFYVADLVPVVVAETTTHIKARLDRGGKISGRVTDASGKGIPDVSVQVYDPDNINIIFNGVTTNSKGNYAIPLAPGNYKIHFSPGTDSGNYAAEWYSNKGDFESADILTIKRFATSAISVQLMPR